MADQRPQTEQLSPQDALRLIAREPLDRDGFGRRKHD